MNICIITSSFPSHPNDTAQAPFLINFIEGIKKRGHRVFLFTQDRESIKEEFLEGVKIKWFPWMKSKKPLVQLNPIHPLDCIRIGSLFYHGKKEVGFFLKENKIDVCLALWVLPGGYFAYHANRFTGIPYSVWALGSDIYRYGGNPFLYPIMKRIVQGAKGVFADGFDLSRRVKEKFGRECFFLATTRTLFSSPTFLKADRGDLASEPYHFLFVGRIEKVKGIDLLLQSAALLREEAMNFHLTIVGKGKMEKWVNSFIDEKGFRGWVTVMRDVDDKQLAILYASSDCVVIPSRSESIPLVFSEALHFDKELIVTDVGDMGMLGQEYGVASVVPSEDPTSLKERMKKKIQSQGCRKMSDSALEIAHRKRKELKQLFNIETSVDRFLADYL